MSVDVKEELEEDGDYRLKKTYNIDGEVYKVDIEEGRGENEQDTMPEVYISKGLTEPVISCDYSELPSKIDLYGELPQEIEEELKGDWLPRNI